MSNLEDLYNKSTSQRVKEARQIPTTPPNFVDVTKQYLKEFKIDEKQGDPTEYTDNALNSFDKELNDLVKPDGFDPNTPLMQWNPKQPYYKPGDPK